MTSQDATVHGGHAAAVRGGSAGICRRDSHILFRPWHDGCLAITTVRHIFPSHPRSRPPRSRPPSRATFRPVRHGPCIRRSGSTASPDGSSRRRFSRRIPRRCPGQAVPQQPLAVGQPDAPSPPVVRNPPRLPGRASPEDLRDFARRNAHFDAGCALLPICGRYVLDVYVPEVPPCRRAPAFEPA